MESKSPEYDVVIIGSGVAGAICASRLADTKARILILEAGDNGLGGFQREQFHRVWEVAPNKSWKTPYLESPNRNYYPSPGNNDVSTLTRRTRVRTEPASSKGTTSGCWEARRGRGVATHHG